MSALVKRLTGRPYQDAGFFARDAAEAAARILELEADNAILVEAMQNMMGAFDTPIARRKIPGAFAKEARNTAKALLSKIDTGENNE